MKYLIDIDGILFQNGKPGDYANAVPMWDNIRRIKTLRAQGHKIILHTSRLSEDGEATLKCLTQYDLHDFDIIYNKPTADAYIDDKALNFIPELGNKDLKGRKTLAICYSGGMDSLIAYYWALTKGYNKSDILLLNFDIGHPYKDKEEKAMLDLGIPWTTFRLNLVREELGNTPSVQNYIIPGRNMIFASIAAGFAHTVWIVGIKFENHYLMYDKNANFYRLASLALSQALGTTTTVETPFLDMSKTDIIKWAKEHGLMNEVSKTVSCYHPTLKRCGECGLCFKRWIAMEAAGINEAHEYEKHPLKSEVARDFIAKYRRALINKDYTHYSEERILETLGIVESKMEIL